MMTAAYLLRLSHLQHSQGGSAFQLEPFPSIAQLELEHSANRFQSFLQKCMDESDDGNDGFDWNRFQRFLVQPGSGVVFDTFRATTLALRTNSSGLTVAESLRDRCQMDFSEELMKQLTATVESQAPQLTSPSTTVAETAQGSSHTVLARRESRALLPLADCRGGDQCFPQALIMTFKRTDGNTTNVGADASKSSAAKSSYGVVINVKMMRVIASPHFKVPDTNGRGMCSSCMHYTILSITCKLTSMMGRSWDLV